ncbi:MAG: DNA-processing protein DprA [Pseudomonadota bacterium]
MSVKSSEPDDSWVPWVELLNVPGVGPRYWHRLLSVWGNPAAILAANASQLKNVIPERVANAIAQRPSAELLLDKTREWLASEGNRTILTWADSRYPSALLNLSDPPPVIFYHGQLTLLANPMLAIVGGRNATSQGCRDAEAWAEALAHEGLTIVSGLAQGIDGAAHKGALKAKGSTIAVIATGVDRIYPSQHRDLAHEIAEKGALLSEFPLGTPAKSPHFPRRNRLISGLSAGCLVIEAAIKSGSLITARLAAEQGRDVFAIPGSIHSPLSKGCHLLIKEGAKLVEAAEDVLEELRGIRAPQLKKATAPQQMTVASNTPEVVITTTLQPHPLSTDPVWMALGYEAVDIDTLSVRTGLRVDQLSARLLEFELEGYIEALAGGRYQRID